MGHAAQATTGQGEGKQQGMKAGKQRSEHKGASLEGLGGEVEACGSEGTREDAKHVATSAQVLVMDRVSQGNDEKGGKSEEGRARVKGRRMQGSKVSGQQCTHQQHTYNVLPALTCAPGACPIRAPC